MPPLGTTDEAVVDHEPRERRGVTRRTVMRGAAVWSVPTVSTVLAAPAFALSCNQLYAGTMDWGSTAASTYSRSTTTPATAASGTVNLAGTGGSVGLSISSAFTNYTPLTTTIPNLTVTTPVGGTAAAGLSLTQVAGSSAASNNNANNQTVTFTFTRNVYNLSFLITDLDYNANQYRDAAAITNATFTTSAVTGSTVTGAGTITNALVDDPFRSTANVAYDNNADSTGNVRVTMAGPLQSFRLVYWNRLLLPSATNLQQGIFVSAMTLQAFSDGC